MSERTEDLATFMLHLINAGMSIEETARQGFAFAMESCAFKNAYPVPKCEQMLDASRLLEKASQRIGIHLAQQKQE